MVSSGNGMRRLVWLLLLCKGDAMRIIVGLELFWRWHAYCRHSNYGAQDVSKGFEENE